MNDVGYNGTTPLLRAAVSSHSECVQALLRAGADTNTTKQSNEVSNQYLCEFLQLSISLL